MHDLVRALVRRKPVEHAVHVLEAVGAAVALGEFDRFVDYDAVRDVRLILQFIRRDEQNRALDRGGKAFVLLDSPLKEIHALKVAFDGTIYAAAFSGTLA